MIRQASLFGTTCTCTVCLYTSLVLKVGGELLRQPVKIMGLACDGLQYVLYIASHHSLFHVKVKCQHDD